MISIDGSHMEGGGQILRTALALSTLTGTSFSADNIRHNRPTPGLKNQHLTCLRALKQIAGAQAVGARLGAATVQFQPADVAAGTFSVNIGTAGSITLLLQAVLLPCMFADGAVRLIVSGGTDTKWSIPIDYFTHVMVPFFNRFAGIRIEKMRRGFYPKGGGIVELAVTPRFCRQDFHTFSEFLSQLRTTLTTFRLTEKKEPIEIRGISAASQKLKRAAVAERQVEGAAAQLRHLFPLDIRPEYCDTSSDGTVITLWALNADHSISMGADALGQRGKRAEEVGAQAAEKLLEIVTSDGVVDHHLADNLIPLLALVGGHIKTNKITAHIQSNVYVCEKFLDVHFAIDAKKKEIRAT